MKITNLNRGDTITAVTTRRYVTRNGNSRYGVIFLKITLKNGSPVIENITSDIATAWDRPIGRMDQKSGGLVINEDPSTLIALLSSKIFGDSSALKCERMN